MRASLEQFLDEVARRGSWLGGGSVAAMCAATAAALLQKLALTRPLVRRLTVIREASLRLVEQDAVMFARAIHTMRSGRRASFERALKAANDVPCRVYVHAARVERIAAAMRKTIRPKFQSDLKCAVAAARAAKTSSKALIDTNLAWLKRPAYTAQIRRRLLAADRHGR